MAEKKRSGLSELLSYAGGHRILVFLSWILSALSAVLALLPFVFIFLIIREAISVAPDFSGAVGIVGNGWLAVIFSLISILVYVASLMCSHLAAFRIAGNIKIALLEKVSRIPVGKVEEIGSGKLRRTITDASSATETYLAHRLPDFVGSIATPVGILFLLFAFDWRFAIAALVPVVLSFISMGGLMGKKMQEDIKNYSDALTDMNGEAVEYVRGIPVVKAFGQTIHSFTRFKESIERYCRFCISYTKKARRPMLVFTVFLNSAFFFITELILVLTVGKSVGQTVLLSALFYIIFTPIVSTVLTKIMFAQEDGMVINDSVSRIRGILEMEELQNPQTEGKPLGSKVEFKNVDFRYGGSERYALKNLSFTASPGQKVALVGPSGSGKTTAANLISRFFDCESGSVEIGGVDVRSIGKEDLSQKISYVFQNTHLLKASIFENVRLGRPGATREEVLSALDRAQCSDILARLPDGIDTVVGSRGTYFSGGEQQRISIARMILKNSDIIVLDEATAFADPENEALVQRSFDELSRGKTVITIAHRLTTVKDSDKIIVLKDGEKVQEGRHEALLEEGGLYAKMWGEYQSSIEWKVGEKK